VEVRPSRPPSGAIRRKSWRPVEDLDRLGAEAAPRFVDDAPKSLVRLAIVGDGREAKQGESVLDLGADVEADIADEAVRDFRAHQGFLEGAREEVVAVEDGHLRPTGAFPFSGDQRVGETGRLGVSVAKAHELDRSALPFPGEQRLAKPRLVLGDDGVGGGEDMAGRACTLEPCEDEGRFAVRLGMRMVRGLANTDAAKIVAARVDRAFASVDDLWRRAGVPSASLVQLAEADAFGPALGLARREALWAIKALRDEPAAEIDEPEVALKPMTAGSEVVEDYSHVGLTLRRHPVAFLRADLQARRIVTCEDAMQARDGRWLEAAGLVLVRQRPGSAKGVLFITLEDETGIANLVVWPQTFEKFRGVVIGASMLAVRGRIQREGAVVHLVAHQLTDLSADLATVGSRDAAFPLPHGRGDQVKGGGGPDPRELPPKGLRIRDIYTRDLHIDTIKVKTRNFH
jgi:hypothetical protein